MHKNFDHFLAYWISNGTLINKCFSRCTGGEKWRTLVLTCWRPPPIILSVPMTTWLSFFLLFHRTTLQMFTSNLYVLKHIFSSYVVLILFFLYSLTQLECFYFPAEHNQNIWVNISNLQGQKSGFFTTFLWLLHFSTEWQRG